LHAKRNRLQTRASTWHSLVPCDFWIPESRTHLTFPSFCLVLYAVFHHRWWRKVLPGGFHDRLFPSALPLIPNLFGSRSFLAESVHQIFSMGVCMTDHLHSQRLCDKNLFHAHLSSVQPILKESHKFLEIAAGREHEARRREFHLILIPCALVPAFACNARQLIKCSSCPIITKLSTRVRTVPFRNIEAWHPNLVTVHDCINILACASQRGDHLHCFANLVFFCFQASNFLDFAVLGQEVSPAMKTSNCLSRNGIQATRTSLECMAWKALFFVPRCWELSRFLLIFVFL